VKKIKFLLSLAVLAATLTTSASVVTRSFDGPIPDCDPWQDPHCGLPPAR